MSIDILKKQIEESDFARYYYFCGSCLYLKNFYINSLKSAMIPREAFLTDIIETDDKDMTVEDFSEAAANLSLQSERKLLILKDFPLSSPVIEAVIKEPDVVPMSTSVIFYSEYTRYDGKLKAFKAFSEFMNKNGLTVTVEPPDRATMVKWVRQVLRKAGKAIGENEVQYLLDNLDNEMYSLKNELEKLASSSSGKEVTEADINRVCTFTLESNAFKVSDALLNRDSDTAYSVINDLIKQNTDENLILGVIYRAMTNMAKIKLLSDKGYSSGEIASITGMKSFIVDRDSRRLKNIKMTTVNEIVEACVQADNEAKGSTLSGEETITKLLALCMSKV